jgi:hypothetical protein
VDSPIEDAGVNDDNQVTTEDGGTTDLGNTDGNETTDAGRERTDGSSHPPKKKYRKERRPNKLGTERL